MPHLTSLQLADVKVSPLRAFVEMQEALMDGVHFLRCVLDTLGAYDPLLLDYMFLI